MSTPYLTPDVLLSGPQGNALKKANVSASWLADYVSEFEEIAEDYRGVAYVTRTVTAEQHWIGWAGDLYPDDTGDQWRGRTAIQLNHIAIQSITSITVEGNTIDPTLYRLDGAAGMLHYAPGFQPLSSLLATYDHGLTASLPFRLRRGCSIYVRVSALADATGVPRDVIGQTMSDGSYTRYNTPDKANGRPTGYTAVDQLLNNLEDFRTPAFA